MNLADLGPEPRTGHVITAVATDGREFPVESTVTAFSAGSALVGLVSLRDISDRLAAQAEAEQLRAEADRERYQRRLEQSQRLESLGQLVGGVAHDFNNMLNVITGHSDSSRSRCPAWPGTIRGSRPCWPTSGRYQGAAERATALTRQLLIFARRDVVHPQVLDVNNVIGGMEHMLAPALSASASTWSPARLPGSGQSRRPGPDPAGDPQPGRQRPRRDARGGQPDFSRPHHPPAARAPSCST